MIRFSLKKGQKGLHTEVCSIHALSEADRSVMFALMQTYYAHTEKTEFLQDLQDKDDVIILRERATDRIVGFSTLKYFDLSHIKSQAWGVFSGDTIVEQSYWGATALQKTFLLHLSRWKLRNRGRQLYWFLISKGYKTYLLMANNFPLHYPRIEESTPALYQQMMDEVYQQLYPDTYAAEQNLIRNAGKSYHLKEGVAAPQAGLIQAFPRIRFFVERNPLWHEGDELACIAEMNLGVLSAYLIKAIKKSLRLPTLAGLRTGLGKRSWQNAN